jgi:hypothetical protein
MSEPLNESSSELTKAMKQFKVHLKTARASLDKNHTVGKAKHYRNLLIFQRDLLNYGEGERLRKLKQWISKWDHKEGKTVDEKIKHVVADPTLLRSVVDISTQRSKVEGGSGRPPPRMEDVIAWAKRMYEKYLRSLDDDDDSQTIHTINHYYQSDDNLKAGTALAYVNGFGHPVELYIRFNPEPGRGGSGLSKKIYKSHTGLDPVKSSFDWQDMMMKFFKSLMFKETNGRGLSQYIADQIRTVQVPNKSIPHIVKELKYQTPDIIPQPKIQGPKSMTGMGIKKANPWIAFLKEYKAKNPGLSHKEAMKKASPLYQASKK